MLAREELNATLAALRAARAEVLAPMPLADIVDVLDATAQLLSERACAEASQSEVRVSLDGLLPSLRRDALRHLLKEEFGDPGVLDGFRPRAGGGMRRALAPAVTAHFFAGNTPLLSWPAFAAGLLLKSAVFGKLSQRETTWPQLFCTALREVSPALGRCIALECWPGGTRELDEALCTEADAVVAYGADSTLATLRSYAPISTPFLGFGHRVSIGVVAQGCDAAAAAEGLARDVILYDQQGCLSAAMVFVEGAVDEATTFGELLAAALSRAAEQHPAPPRSIADAITIRTARQTALFAPESRVWGDPAFRWTILLSPGALPEPRGGACIVPLHPLADWNQLPALLYPLRGRLQGAALAAPPERLQPIAAILAEAGINRVCPPGKLQAPPFCWHQDGRQVLTPLVHWTDLEFPEHVS